jgi:hypothetical protein
MINPQLLLQNILDNRCCRGNQPLRNGEHVVSQIEMPGLYEGKLEAKDRAYLKEVFDILEPNEVSNRFFTELRKKGNQIRLESFYLQVMARVPDLLESVLHQFIYRYWDKLDSTNALGFPSSLEVFYKGRGETGTTVEVHLLQKLRKAGCNCDLVGVSEDKCLWLVDVKRDGIDDRAIGQIRRYYELASEILESYEINLSVRLVRPALICREIPVSRFFSLGLPFRDICEIWTYSIERSQLMLHDRRLQLLGQIRGKKHLSEQL